MKLPLLLRTPLSKGFLILVSALPLASCNEGDRSTLEPEIEQAAGLIVAMTVELPQTWPRARVTVDKSGQIFFGPTATGAALAEKLVIEPDYYSPEDDSWVNARFYDSRAEVRDLTGYELRVVPQDPILRPLPEFVPAGSLVVVFRRERAGFTALTFELVRTADGQSVFGPFTVPAEVRVIWGVPVER